MMRKFKETRVASFAIASGEGGTDGLVVVLMESAGRKFSLGGTRTARGHHDTQAAIRVAPGESLNFYDCIFCTAVFGIPP